MSVLDDSAASARRAARGALHWLDACVPPASAESLAVFRVVFGAVLIAYFTEMSISPAWVGLASPESAFHRLALPAFAAAPVVVEWIRPWIIGWTIVFMAGAMARTSFAMMTAGALAWGLLYTMRVGAHSVQILLVTMLCLLWSRWGDAWSVDAWLRTRARSADAREYGYPMWVPGLVLGTSLAAAAFAKLWGGGIGWITNGTVKYHFLTDSPQAPVDWGLWIAQYHGLAVLVSFGAVAVEALVIVGACSTRYRYRVAAGVATLALLVGFKLFQGLFWPAWYIALLSFLPWHLIRPASPASAPSAGATHASPLRWAQTAVVLVLLGQQAVASALNEEASPLMSAYDMYSTTYASPADYDAKSGLTYWVVADFPDGTRDECKVGREDAEAVAARQTESTRVTEVIEDCFDPRSPIRSLSAEARKPSVDWERWRFGPDVKVPLGGPASPESSR